MAATKKKSPRDSMHYTRLFLWRHPEVSGSYEGRFWGQTDVHLTRFGDKQRKAVAKYMSGHKVSAVYSSDLQRCRLTAEAVARAQKPRGKVFEMKELRELNLGEWEGKTYHEIEEQYPGALEERTRDLAHFTMPGGESLTQMAERVIPAFKQMIADRVGQRICMIGHAGVNRIIMCKILGAPLTHIFRMDQEYAGLNVIDVFEDGLPLIRRLNLKVVKV